MTHVFFDLDGTLLDSADGIVRAYEAVALRFSIPYRDVYEFRRVIGPPLYQCFLEDGIPKEKHAEALSVFQEYYARRGVYENRLYDGVREALTALREAGVHTYVVTAKPEHFALSILERLSVLSLFDGVRGADMNEREADKRFLLGDLLKREGITPSMRMAMVGDRSYDILGGRSLGIYTVGVLWGNGSRKELLLAGADRLFAKRSELCLLSSL